MTPAPRRSGRSTVFLLVGGSILFCLLLLGWLFPSLRQYRSRGVGVRSAGAPAPVGGPPGGESGANVGGGAGGVSGGEATPGDSTHRPQLLAAGPPATSQPEGPLSVTEESEGGGRVRIEPAPFQPPPQRVPESPAALPPPGAPAVADTAAVAGGGADHAGAAAEAPAPAAAPVLAPPVVLKAAWLRYPEEARRRKREGSVEVRILVAETGGVKDVQLVSGAGDTALDNAALSAARATLFRPAHLGEQPVAVWYNYRFVFSVPHER